MCLKTKCLITLIAAAMLPKWGVSKNNVRSYSDRPYVNKRQTLSQLIYVSSDSSIKGFVNVRCGKYITDIDSVTVFSYASYPLALTNGINKISLIYAKDDTNASLDSRYLEIIKRSGCIAPGIYKTYIEIRDTPTNRLYSFCYLQEVDSAFPGNSVIRSDINKKLAPTGSFESLAKKAEKVKAYASDKAVRNAQRKLKSISGRRGFTHIQYEKGNSQYVDFYYESWFAGRYVAEKNKKLSVQLLKEDEITGAGNLSRLADNDLNARPSLFSQFKTFKKQKDSKQEVKGELSTTTSMATAQEPNSGVDNNYLEFRGDIELPVMNLPFQLEGMYTTQDANRKVKASFIHVHYDVSKMKDELRQFIGEYNQKFAETRSKTIGMEQVYEKGIQTLESRKRKLADELKETAKAPDEANIKTPDKNDFTPNGLSDTTLPGNGLTQAQKARKKLESDKQKAAEKRKEIEALEKKIERYRLLLEQNRNTNYFDSAVGYARTSRVRYQDEVSYKRLAKAGADLLPEGTVKKITTGVSSFDAGMFSKYTSKYTMAGQMFNGVDAAYDLGFSEIGFSVGSTQYAGRDGGLDKYTCYSLRDVFNIGSDNKITLVYYGYSPQHSLYRGDGFFKDIDVNTPTFYKQVHIGSVNYTGNISKYFTAAFEAASIIPTAGQGGSSGNLSDKMGLHAETEGTIPNSSVQLHGSFDKTGRDFDNKTLPLALKGTEQYKIGGATDLFKGFVSLKCDYYYLSQSSTAFSGSNTKWGFEIKTHSKRYPAVSVSYKPYSTFKTFSDTLNIPQRPVFGSVLTSRASCQFKHNGSTWRYSITWNQSATEMDTTKYGNSLIQGMCIYGTKSGTTATATLGYMEQYGGQSSTTGIPTSMAFSNLGAAFVLNRELTVNSGIESGISKFGLCRYSFVAGTSVVPRKKPFAIRANIRAGAYRLKATDVWSSLYNGSIELTYKFRHQISKTGL